jgi:circadian clock protein KaiC
VNTSLLISPEHQEESTPIQVSTLADVWIHLSNLVRSGERNRALTIIKARGTGHSNQVREVLLDERGVTLTEAYSADGGVLMGSLRWQKEEAERRDGERLREEVQRKRREVEIARLELRSRIEVLQHDLANKQAEMETLMRNERTSQQTSMARLRIRSERGNRPRQRGVRAS